MAIKAPMKERDPERNAQIVAKYKAGMTRRQLAQQYHLSRSRVCQILEYNGIHGPAVPPRGSYPSVTVTVPPDVLAEVRRIAQEDRTTPSGLLREWILERLAVMDRRKVV